VTGWRVRVGTDRVNKKTPVTSCVIGVHRKRAKGLEPSTFTLATGVPNVLSAQNTELANPAANACTAACTESGETGNAGTADAADTGFASALAMIATLPLSPAEKAEAVRRLLAAMSKPTTP
jgi:hypothetical protein